MTRFAIAAALSAMLVACGPADSGSETTQPPQAPETGRMIPVEPDGGIGDGAGPPEDAAAVARNAIPARFRGVWDYRGGTCDPTSDMRMEISNREILFYESIGLVSDVKPEGDAIIVTLDMEGEGETWQQQTRFMLTERNGEELLESSEGDAPPVVDEYPSKRCPT